MTTTVVRRIRTIAAVAGIGLIALALLGDHLSGASFALGWTQSVALLIGGALALAATLGSGLPAFWRGASLLLLNTLLLVVLLDLAAWFALLRVPTGRYAGSLRAPYYDAQPWTAEYGREFSAVNESYRFAPYLLWEGRPSPGRLVSVDADGHRTTPGADCQDGAYRIAMLGGSTLWGVGAPDSLTISGLLQRDLAEHASRPICVVNLGERAYVSTQELMRLMLELQRGRVPDLVILYDGTNDVIHAWRHGEPGTHSSVDRIERRLKGEPGWQAWIRSWHLARLAQRLAERRAERENRTPPARITPDSMSRAVAGILAANCRMAAALGSAQGFRTLCFLQPSMAVGAKPLTPAERASLALMPASHRALFDSAFAQRRRLRDVVPVEDLTGAFDAETTTVYIDWFHHTPVGNALVARPIADAVRAVPGFPLAGTRRR